MAKESKATGDVQIVGNLRHLSQMPSKRSSAGAKFFRFIVFGVFTWLFYASCVILDGVKERWYIFDPKDLHQLAKRSLASHSNDTRAVVDAIVTELRASYPAYAISQEEEWIFNNAGGAMGAMYIIHASITEYLIIFGTPLGTEGHTGRHTADDYFHILEGEQWAFTAGSLDKEVYPAGSVHHLPRGQVKQYKMHEGCWAMELAQGWIPLMLPFGVMDTLTSTLDVPTFYHTARITAREQLRNLWNGKI